QSHHGWPVAYPFHIYWTGSLSGFPECLPSLSPSLHVFSHSAWSCAYSFCATLLIPARYSPRIISIINGGSSDFKTAVCISLFSCPTRTVIGRTGGVFLVFST